MADARVQNILDILNKEYAYYKDLLEISKAKKRVIIEGKVAELDKLIKLEQNMIFDIGQLERSREAVFAGICFELGLKSNAALSDLAEKLDGFQRNSLEKAQKSLLSILEDLKTANSLNNDLIKQSLEYIDYSINIITSAGTASASLYESMDDRGKKPTDKKRLFDTKV